MRHAIKSLCLIALACGTLASCEKEGLSGNGGSKDITFVTSSASTATRTAYSGKGTTSNNVLTAERIDWVVGDSITIWSDNAVQADDANLHWNNYKVETVTAENAKSKATIAPMNESKKGLKWTGASSYKFYGRYPAGETKIDGTSMSAEIPSAQEMVSVTATNTAVTVEYQPSMEYAFMFASATTTSETDPVTMDFYPKFTALRFEISGGGNESVDITKFELSSTSGKLSGAFKVACSDGTAALDGTGNAAVSVDMTKMTDSKLTLTADARTAITLFALPINFSDLTLTVEGEKIGTRTFKLNKADGTAIKFIGGNKYRISGLDIPELLIATGEDINWDVEAAGEDIYWD